MKKPIWLIFLFGALLFIQTSCSKRMDCCIPLPLSVQVFISISNQKGIDLLDQSKSDAFKIEEIKAFYVKNNQEYYVNGSSESSKLIKIQNDNLNYYQIHLSTNLINNKSRTIIKWDNQHVDTLDAEFFPENQANRLSKVFVNSKEMLDTDNLSENKFLYRIHLTK